MLIIFDLDDTLIDTSGCITPVKLEDSLRCMVEAGLEVEDFPEALAHLKRLDEGSASARDALAEFLEIHGAAPHLLEIGIKEVYENISPDLPIFPFDGVIEILKELSHLHYLALVSIGKPHQQLAKLKKAGIDSTIFSKIGFCEGATKGVLYKSIVEELGLAAADVVVCGDRIERDLAPAKELGYKAIHLRKGRGRIPLGLKSDVDYTVSEFIELPEIIAHFFTF